MYTREVGNQERTTTRSNNICNITTMSSIAASVPPEGGGGGSVLHCHSESEYYAAMEAAGDRLVVVDCFAPWCPPCRAIAPVFEALAVQYPSVVFLKVDMDQVPTLKNVLGVWALPTFCFFRYGKRVGSFMGANERLLRRGLENNGEVSMCSGMCVIH